MSDRAVTILVVDDNPATRDSASSALRSAGWSVLESETGAQAIGMARSGIDLLVMTADPADDVVGPTLRQHAASAHLPILIVADRCGTAGIQVAGCESVVDGYLTYPIEPPVLIATVRALLRTRQAEMERRLSEARFQAIFENALTGVALLDRKLTFVGANATMGRLLNCERSQLVGQPVRGLVPAEYHRDFEPLEYAVRHQRAWRGNLPLMNSQGQSVYLEWDVPAWADAGHRLANISDISDRLKFASERESILLSERAARTAAENTNRLKDEFLAALSHELRTPLNAIVGWSQILRTGKATAEDLADGLEAIERNARAQAQMIADLLDVSRITSGKLRLNIESFDPIKVVDAALAAVAPAAQEKSIRITKAIEPGCGPISGDASRLQQVIWNLVSNAVKFTPPNGHVQVALRKINASIEIRVTDDGQGISPEMQPRLFDRFRQGDSSSTREHGGLGLGLAIAKQLVEMHGGSISAHSAGPNRGASFIVLLPTGSDQTASGRDAAGSGDPAHNDPVNLAGTRILLVEDDADSRKMLKRVLVDSGADIHEAASVDQALVALADFQPGILISDLGMPGRDGFELIHEVRQRGHTSQRLPAIALTAFARAEDRSRALRAGFQVHLAKPVNPQELTSTIASLVDHGN